MVDLKVLSLGAGVQSSTLALMMEMGEIEKPDVAIFSDTMSEPKKVMEWLEYLKTQVSFPIHIVSKGNLRQDTLDAAQGIGKYKYVTIHVYTVNAETKKKGLLRRQCTGDYKILPVNAEVRKCLGLKRYQHIKKGTQVDMYMGISYDEVTRMRTNQVKYINNKYPLVDLKMRRQDCIEWMEKNNYPKPPRSACTFCPYHSDKEWKLVRENKKEWDDVIALDKAIRHGTKKPEDEIFLHRSCKPIDEVDFDEKSDQYNMFENDCQGMCGI